MYKVIQQSIIERRQTLAQQIDYLQKKLETQKKIAPCRVQQTSAVGHNCLIHAVLQGIGIAEQNLITVAQAVRIQLMQKNSTVGLTEFLTVEEHAVSILTIIQQLLEIDTSQYCIKAYSVQHIVLQMQYPYEPIQHLDAVGNGGVEINLFCDDGIHFDYIQIGDIPRDQINALPKHELPPLKIASASEIDSLTRYLWITSPCLLKTVIIDGEQFTKICKEDEQIIIKFGCASRQELLQKWHDYLKQGHVQKVACPGINIAIDFKKINNQIEGELCLLMSPIKPSQEDYSNSKKVFKELLDYRPGRGNPTLFEYISNYAIKNYKKINDWSYEEGLVRMMLDCEDSSEDDSSDEEENPPLNINIEHTLLHPTEIKLIQDTLNEHDENKYVEVRKRLQSYLESLISDEVFEQGGYDLEALIYLRKFALQLNVDKKVDIKQEIFKPYKEELDNKRWNSEKSKSLRTFLYRGFHFTPTYFNQSQRRTLRQTELKGTLTESSELSRRLKLNNIKTLEQHVEEIKNSVDKLQNIPKTNNHPAIVGSPNKTRQNRTYDSLWPLFIETYVENYNELFNKQHLESYFENDIEKNPIISTSYLPEKSVYYASGGRVKSNDPQHQAQHRLNPHFRRFTLKAKHPYLGLTFVYSMDLKYFHTFGVRIWDLINDKTITITPRKRNECEVFFIAAIAGKYLVEKKVFQLPKFDNNRHKSFESILGTSVDQYMKKWLDNCHCKLKNLTSPLWQNGNAFFEELDTILKKAIEYQSAQLIKCVETAHREKGYYNIAPDTKEKSANNYAATEIENLLSLSSPLATRLLREKQDRDEEKLIDEFEKLSHN